MNEEGRKQVSDEKLILEYRKGNETAVVSLMNKYKNLVRKKAGSMYLLGADREDLIQEGMIGLFKAIRDYDLSQEAGFFTFADLCVSRQMYTAVQASNRQKHIPLNTYISIYSENRNVEEGSEEYALINSLAMGKEKSPEEMLIEQENMEQMESAILKELSEFERQVFELHLTGMSYIQIAKVLGRDEKATDNALQRMKTKMKKLLKDYRER